MLYLPRDVVDKYHVISMALMVPHRPTGVQPMSLPTVRLTSWLAAARFWCFSLSAIEDGADRETTMGLLHDGLIMELVAALLTQLLSFYLWYGGYSIDEIDTIDEQAVWSSRSVWPFQFSY